MKKYSPSRSASRQKDDPYNMAVSLARRLYMLDAFKKSEVAEKLADSYVYVRFNNMNLICGSSKYPKIFFVTENGFDMFICRFEFGQPVGTEYLKWFEFEGLSLDESVCLC